MKLYVDKLENKTYGHIVFAVSDKGLRKLSFGRYKGFVDILEHACRYGFEIEENSSRTSGIKDQLERYFNGDQRQFKISLDIEYLPEFKRKILQATFEIPAGMVLSYGELARKAGSPKAARAVGQVMATNPIPIVIPCHRIVGHDGHLTGFSGGDGLEVKKRLLISEGLAVRNNKIILN